MPPPSGRAAGASKAVYTYGQPAAGTSGYRDFIAENYADSYFRFVNEDDIVPRVPPGYVHVGHLIHFGEESGWPRGAVVESSAAEPPMMNEKEFRELQERLRTRGQGPVPLHEEARTELEGLWPSVSDHSMNRYIEKILSQIG